MRVLILVYAVAIAAVLPSLPAQALIEQQIVFSIDTDLSDIFDDDQNGASVDNTGGPIVSAIAAGISGASGGISYVASGSVGPFGNFGLEAALTGGTMNGAEQRTQVYISSDEFVNLTGFAQNAEANFILDGGSFFMDAGVGSTLSYTLTIRKDLDLAFQSFGNMTVDAGGDVSLLTGGTDIGAMQIAPNEVEIPFSFQSVDLGTILPNQGFQLEYQLDIVADIQQFAEGIFYSFSDPLGVDGFQEYPTVAFQVQMTSVPEPNTFILLGFGLIALMYLRRRSLI